MSNIFLTLAFLSLCLVWTIGAIAFIVAGVNGLRKHESGFDTVMCLISICAGFGMIFLELALFFH